MMLRLWQVVESVLSAADRSVRLPVLRVRAMTMSWPNLKLAKFNAIANRLFTFGTSVCLQTYDQCSELWSAQLHEHDSVTMCTTSFLERCGDAAIATSTMRVLCAFDDNASVPVCVQARCSTPLR